MRNGRKGVKGGWTKREESKGLFDKQSGDVSGPAGRMNYGVWNREMWRRKRKKPGGLVRKGGILRKRAGVGEQGRASEGNDILLPIWSILQIRLWEVPSRGDGGGGEQHLGAWGRLSKLYGDRRGRIRGAF